MAALENIYEKYGHIEPFIETGICIRGFNIPNGKIFNLFGNISIPFLLIIILFGIQNNCSAEQKTFILWQLPSLGGLQMNSYVIKTVSGKIIVIDGGYNCDAEYLKGFLAALGNHVDLWFVSHQHQDHVEALTTILKKPDGLKIDKIYGSMLDEEWIKRNEPGGLSTAVDFNRALRQSRKQVKELILGQIIDIDQITIEILGIKNPEIIKNAINNSSVVMKVSDKNKSVLFTGDLGMEGSEKLLNSPYRSHFKADYVQMAHHGQDGVSEEFYKVVNPKYCIWPTPKWLWDNDNGKGPGSGSWKTQEVRKWMDKLNIQKHYILFEGLVCIENVPDLQ